MASLGVHTKYNSLFTNLLSLEKSTQMRMCLEFFFGVTTVGAQHSVGSVTSSMNPCAENHCNSFVGCRGKRNISYVMRPRKWFSVVFQVDGKRLPNHHVYLPKKHRKKFANKVLRYQLIYFSLDTNLCWIILSYYVLLLIGFPGDHHATRNEKRLLKRVSNGSVSSAAISTFHLNLAMLPENR